MIWLSKRRSVFVNLSAEKDSISFANSGDQVVGLAAALEPDGVASPACTSSGSRSPEENSFIDSPSNQYLMSFMNISDIASDLT